MPTMDHKEVEATCTICGLKYNDRVAFNAHIRAHLKDKLTNRREQQRLMERQKSTSPHPGRPPLSLSSSMTTTTAATVVTVPPSSEDTKVTKSPVSIPMPAPTIPSSAPAKRAKVVHVKDQQSSRSVPVTNARLTNIQSLLPSAPLPISKTPVMKDKPDLEALLSQLKSNQKLVKNHPMVMAELAACKPIPLQEVVADSKSVTSTPTSTMWASSSTTAATVSSSSPTTPSSSIESSQLHHVKSEAAEEEVVEEDCAAMTPDISDMDEDIMSYEMEMNRIDFHNDLASILDQIEKDFESPCLSHDLRLDTPPDSDCENTEQLNRLLNVQSTMMAPCLASSTTIMPSSSSNNNYSNPPSSNDLLGLDRFTQRIPILDHNETSPNLLKLEEEQPVRTLVQSPASVAKVGKLPAKTLAVLNKLPAKLFGPSTTTPSSLACGSNSGSRSSLMGSRISQVDVVKVNHAHIGGQLLTAGAQCIINIECRQPGKSPDEPAKIIQTFRAIDTGTEIKLVPADLPVTVTNAGVKKDTTTVPPNFAALNSINQDKSKMSVAAVPSVVVPTALSNSSTTSSSSSTTTSSSNSSYCKICNKCITNKNMGRHLEKHQKKDLHTATTLMNKNQQRKSNAEISSTTSSSIGGSGNSAAVIGMKEPRKFLCKFCCKAFSQRSHLSRHTKAHTSSVGHDLLTCKACGKVCKNRVSLVRHRAKHLSCIHCSAVFENRNALQDHLLKAHPEKAIVSLVQPPVDVQDNASNSSSRLDLDDIGSIGSTASRSIDYSFSPNSDINDNTNRATAVSTIGEDDGGGIGDSLADIADSNYFFSHNTDLTEDLYSSDLFIAQTC